MSVIEKLNEAISRIYVGGDGSLAQAVLSALNLTEARAAALMDGSAVVVPVEPTHEMLVAIAPFPEDLVREREAEGHVEYRRMMEVATQGDQLTTRATYQKMLAASQQPEETRG